MPMAFGGRNSALSSTKHQPASYPFCRLSARRRLELGIISILLVLLYTVYWGLLADSQFTDKQSKFEQDLIRANQELFAGAANGGSLDIYGLAEPLRKTDTWHRKAQYAKSTPNEALNYVSAVSFNGNSDAKFVLDESLSSHIEQTLVEHQRFLSTSIVQLQNTLSSIVNVTDRESLERKLIVLSAHSTEFSRVLRKEIGELRVRLGHRARSERVLSQLKAKIRSGVERRQAYSCERAFLCDVSDQYGFASGIHFILWCFVNGVRQDRRVIVDTTNWHYTPKATPWEKIFAPLGRRPEDNCGRIPYPDIDASLYEIPDEIAKPLVQHHSNPYAWWLAQLMGYIMRPSEFVERRLHEMKSIMEFRSPIVGVHIRRTDKLLREGGFHRVEEYMAHVEDYFRDLTGSNVSRRVFIATDEPAVIDELRHKFPQYVFITNEESAGQANNLATRYSDGALTQLVVDLYLLSETDKLVCTFSSGVCRVAYELRLANSDDLSEFAVSLDVSYYYSYKLGPPRRAVHAHRPIEMSELPLAIGDCVVSPYPRMVDREANEKVTYDGFSVGKICRSDSLQGKYPLYKTVPTVVSINQTKR